MWNLLKHDFKQGTLRMWQGYICAFMICCGSAVYLRSIIDNLISYGSLFSSGTMIDYYMFSLKGLEVYKITKESTFQIPVYWFCYHLILAYIIGYYAEKDFTEYGKNSILATKTRIGWWMAKCIWCVVSVLLYYLMGFLGTAFYTFLADGKLSFVVTKELMKGFGQGLIYLSNTEILVLVLVLPCLISIAVSLLQMLLSIRIGSVASFAGVCIMYVMSVYYTSPFLLGNYTMWRRNHTVGVGSGVYTTIGLFISLIIIVVVMLAGVIYIDRKDIL